MLIYGWYSKLIIEVSIIKEACRIREVNLEKEKGREVCHLITFLFLFRAL